jgi:hypothetical protein
MYKCTLIYGFVCHKVKMVIRVYVCIHIYINIYIYIYIYIYTYIHTLAMQLILYVDVKCLLMYDYLHVYVHHTYIHLCLWRYKLLKKHIYMNMYICKLYTYIYMNMHLFWSRRSAKLTIHNSCSNLIK